MKILLDTCAILWAISDPQKLSEKAKTALKKETNEIFVSPMSCAEVACASDRGKIKLDRHWRLWFRHFVELNGWTSISIDLEITEEAYSLPTPFHQDPADRILIATARLHQCKLLTADSKILNYPHVQSLW